MFWRENLISGFRLTVGRERDKGGQAKHCFYLTNSASTSRYLTNTASTSRYLHYQDFHTNDRLWKTSQFSDAQLRLCDDVMRLLQSAGQGGQILSEINQIITK